MPGTSICRTSDVKRGDDGIFCRLVSSRCPNLAPAELVWRKAAGSAPSTAAARTREGRLRCPADASGEGRYGCVTSDAAGRGRSWPEQLK